MNVQYDLVVDFKRPSKSNTIIVSENDDRSRVCHFILVQDKQPMDMTDVVSADIIGTKPDGTVVFDTSNVEIVRNEAGDCLNELMYTVPGNLTSVSGTVTMRIRILSETSKIESFDFYLVVRNSLYNEDDEIDKETYDGFRELLEQCQKTLEEMKKYAGEATRPNPFPISITVEDDTYTYSGISPVELSITNVAYVGEDIVIETEALEESSVEKCKNYAQTCAEAEVVALEGKKAAEKAMVAAATSSENADNSEANALVSEGYAVGTQNGEPVVDPDSPYYHNNSKYWSELSKGGGSEVNWSQLETSGTHIADITINGETTEVFAPEGSGSGGSVVEWKQLITWGTSIAEITIDGKKTSVKTPPSVSTFQDLSDVSVASAESDSVIQYKPSGSTMKWVATQIESPVIRDKRIYDLTLNNILQFLANEINDSQKTLVAGDNITIDENNVISAIGGGSGTSNYNLLSNKPQINDVELSGNKSLADLGVASASDLQALSDLVGQANALLEGV